MRTSVNSEFKTLADRMLTHKKNTPVTFVHFNPAGVDVPALMTRLRNAPFADLLLPEGASLSMPHGGDYYPDLGVTASDALVERVSLTALGWNWERYAQYPESPVWGRQIELSLWYGRGGRTDSLVKQVLASSAYDRRGRPDISRDVWADAYAETGYEGHNQAYRNTHSAAEAKCFLDIIAELFALTPEGTS